MLFSSATSLTILFGVTAVSAGSDFVLASNITSRDTTTTTTEVNAAYAVFESFATKVSTVYSDVQLFIADDTLSNSEVVTKVTASVETLKCELETAVTAVASIPSEAATLAASIASDKTTTELADLVTSILSDVANIVTVLRQNLYDIPGLSPIIGTLAGIIDGPLAEILQGLDTVVGGVLDLIGNLFSRVASLAFLLGASTVSARGPFAKESDNAPRDLDTSNLNDAQAAAAAIIQTFASNVETITTEIQQALTDASSADPTEIVQSITVSVTNVITVIEWAADSVQNIPGDNLPLAERRVAPRDVSDDLSHSITQAITQLANTITALEQQGAQLPGIGPIVIQLSEALNGPLTNFLQQLDTILTGLVDQIGAALESSGLGSVLSLFSGLSTILGLLGSLGAKRA
ncbi:Sc15 protein [Pseudohyphozyma bogoriensis]|nr:Sc15 protein [Pseudohyphozyma bogoriensis]